MKPVRIFAIALASSLLALPPIAQGVPTIDCTNPPSTWTATSVTVKVTGLAVGQRCTVSVWDGPYLTCPVVAADVKGSAISNPADGSGNVTVTVATIGAAAGDTVIVNTHSLCVGAVELTAPNTVDCTPIACPVCTYGACCDNETNGCFRVTALDCKDLNNYYYGDGSTCPTDGNCIPTVSEWGLLAFMLLVLTAATVVIMRRRAAVV